MKIAHIVEAFAGGVVTYLRTMLPSLVAHGCQVSLICSLNRNWPDSAPALSQLKQGGVDVKVIPMARGIRPATDAGALGRLCRILAAGRFDVVHTHASKAGLLGRIAAKVVGIRGVVHTPHCFAFLRMPSVAGRWGSLRIERALGRFTRMLVGVSDDEVEAAMANRIMPRNKCVCIDNPCPDDPEGLPGLESPESVKEALGVPSGASVVLTVGRLTRYKGILQFLDVAAASTTADGIFLVAGEGQMRPELEAYIAARGLQQKVRLLGHVTNMGRLYGAADVVVSCSSAEGQPYALLEAMQAGRAVVAASVPGNRSLIRNETLGRLAPATPQCIATAVDRLLAEPETRARLGQAARAWCRKHHDPAAQAQKLLEIYARHS